MTEFDPIKSQTMPVLLKAPKYRKRRMRHSFWLKPVVQSLQRCVFGRLKVVLPDQEIMYFGPPSNHQAAQIFVRDYAMFRRMALGGIIGLAESYMAGEWESPDLSALFVFAIQNKAVLRGHMRGGQVMRLINRAYHLVHANTRRGSRRNIAYHYDLGNAFYKHWLDSSMTYSSALYAQQDEALETAQDRKYARICTLAELKAGQSVLEIGCGWGSFARTAVQKHGVDVTGLTLSREQKSYAISQNKDIGDKAEFSLTDYRDATGQYDRIVSIEMFEAVGEENWGQYFHKLKQCLKPGGVAVLQVISIDDEAFKTYRRSADFIQRYIFPGGLLPSKAALSDAINEAGLILEYVENFGQSYAKTLAVWRESFVKAWPDIKAQGFDERFRRMWQFYLSYCEAGFLTGQTDVGFYKIRRR